MKENVQTTRGKPRVLLVFAAALVAVVVSGIAPQVAKASLPSSVTVGKAGQYYYPCTWEYTGNYYDTTTGNRVICVDPQLIGATGTFAASTYPANPTSLSGDYWDDAAYIAMWYGYGSPGFDKSMWPSTDWNGNPMSEASYVIASHVTLSYLYSGDVSAATSGASTTFYNWVQNTLNPGKFYSLASSGKMSRSSLEKQGFDLMVVNASHSGGTQAFVTFRYIPRGAIKLQKTSKQSYTQGLSTYSLQGATYGIYSDSTCKSSVGTLTTDANGAAKVEGLLTGTYFVKETKAPKGYCLNSTVYKVVVSAGAEATVSVVDDAINDPQSAILQKLDGDVVVAAGAGTLEGAEFTVKFYDNTDGDISGTPKRTWVFKTDEDGHVRYNNTYYVSGDELFSDTFGNTVMPLGTYTVQETKAPEGYLLSGNTLYKAQVKQSGDSYVWENMDGWNNVQAVEADGRGIDDQVKRMDLRFQKKDENTMETMANVAFRVTSETTGESHIIVTDANGIFDSSNFDEDMCDNANDAAIAEDGSIDETKLDATHGIWFTGLTDTTTQAHDGLSAFVYDTYRVEELATSTNADHKLVSFTVVIEPSAKRDSTVLDYGTLDDKNITLYSEATDAEDGDSYVEATADAALTDDLYFQGLVAGQTYTIHTSIVDKATAEPIYEFEGEFTPKLDNGTTTVTTPLDLSEYAGHDLVFFEYVLDGGGNLVVSHEDIDDADQTLHVTHLASLLTDTDGNKSAVASEELELVDTLTYQGLVAGESYTAEGRLVTVDGETVVSEAGATFEADESGTATVSFTFDATEYAGQDVVALEYIYDEEGRLVTSHEDLEDADQTFTIEVPEVVEEVEPLAQTGNGVTSLVLVVGGLALAFAAGYYLSKQQSNK